MKIYICIGYMRKPSHVAMSQINTVKKQPSVELLGPFKGQLLGA